jgi:hypothetical protein
LQGIKAQAAQGAKAFEETKKKGQSKKGSL